MSTNKRGGLPQLLDPIDRFGEILFGLIMVLTFTGSLSAAEAGHGEVRTMLIAATGCNVAWGLVDAVMYLMGTYTERQRGARVLAALRASTDPAAAHRILADALPPVVASAMGAEELEAVRRKLVNIPSADATASLRRRDFMEALAVFGWVIGATCPVLIPFLFIGDANRALRISNVIAIAMLFAVGTSLGHYAGMRRWRVGVLMVLIGAALVGLTMALGG